MIHNSTLKIVLYHVIYVVEVISSPPTSRTDVSAQNHLALGKVIYSYSYEVWLLATNSLCVNMNGSKDS